MHLNKGSNDTICIVTEQLYQLSVIWINKEKGFIFFKQNADLDGLFIYVNRPKIWSLLWKKHTFLCSLLWTRDTQSLRPRLLLQSMGLGAHFRDIRFKAEREQQCPSSPPNNANEVQKHSTVLSRLQAFNLLNYCVQ